MSFVVWTRERRFALVWGLGLPGVPVRGHRPAYLTGHSLGPWQLQPWPSGHLEVRPHHTLRVWQGDQHAGPPLVLRASLGAAMRASFWLHLLEGGQADTLPSVGLESAVKEGGGSSPGLGAFPTCQSFQEAYAAG